MLFEGLLVFPICRCSPTVLLVLTKQGSRAVRSRLPASRSVSPSLCFCWYVCLPLFFFFSLSFSLTHRDSVSVSPSQPRTASSSSLGVSQSSPSLLSLLPLTPSPLSLPSLYSRASASHNFFATSSWPCLTATSSGVIPFCGAGEAVSSQASFSPHAADPKTPPPPTLPRSHSLSYLLR